jgi:hypothetical protein
VQSGATLRSDDLVRTGEGWRHRPSSVWLRVPDISSCVFEPENVTLTLVYNNSGKCGVCPYARARISTRQSLSLNHKIEVYPHR